MQISNKRIEGNDVIFCQSNRKYTLSIILENSVKPIYWKKRLTLLNYNGKLSCKHIDVQKFSMSNIQTNIYIK